MPDPFSFRLIATDGAARTGEMTTAHGAVRTPAFMPVGTQAAVKGVHHDDVRAAGAELLLANTYHLMLRPSAERVAALGGLHAFMGWPGPILTDSGGFQVMSLAPLRKIAEDGRHLPLAYRRRDGGADAGARRRNAGPARLRHRHAARRMRAAAAPSATTSSAPCSLSLRWAERCKRAFERAPAGPRAVRHRAGRRRSRRCASRARARSSTSAFTATPSAALRSASRRSVMLRDGCGNRAGAAGGRSRAT